MTHTVQRGYLEDLPNKKACYGWNCIQVEKNPRNPGVWGAKLPHPSDPSNTIVDTIAMFGLAQGKPQRAQRSRTEAATHQTKARHSNGTTLQREIQLG
jgi:hypothetical protein